MANDEWKHDIIPEILDGKNIADFIDPDILDKLDALEKEEEKLTAEGFYDSDEEIVSFLSGAILETSLIFNLFFRSTLMKKSSSPRKRLPRGPKKSRNAKRCSRIDLSCHEQLLQANEPHPI